MTVIDVMGKPCPIPVIEAKKELSRQDSDGVLVKVDNIVAVQNLEKMAKGRGYEFSYTESAGPCFEVTIGGGGVAPPLITETDNKKPPVQRRAAFDGMVVVIGKNAMGDGADELGKILIKGFIYSLSELPTPPAAVIFLNSGAYLTSDGAGTIDDLKKLEAKGTIILTCGTCVNYYGLQEKLAVGTITDMYGITEKIASAASVVNI